MPRFPILDQPMVVIELEPGQVSPEGASWIEAGPVIGGGWALDGNVPVTHNPMSAYGGYDSLHEALREAVDFALWENVATLYVEIDARRCD